MSDVIPVQIDYVDNNQTIYLDRINLTNQTQLVINTLPIQLQKQYNLKTERIFNIHKDQDNHFLVDIEPKLLDITNNNPQATKEIKRIIQITYVDANNHKLDYQPSKIEQKAILHRRITQNLVNQQINYGPYNQDVFPAIKLEPKHHLVPSMSQIPEEQITDQTPDHTISITYRTQLITQKVYYVNNNNLIQKQTFTRPYQSDITKELSIPRHYQYVTNPINIRVIDDLTPIILNVTPKISILTKPHPKGFKYQDTILKQDLKQTDLEHIVTRYINLNLPDGQKQIQTQKAAFTRIAKLNHVTGTITYGAWSNQKQLLHAIDLPKIYGYTPVIKHINEAIVSPNDQDINLNIPYQKINPIEHTTNLIIKYMYNNKCILKETIAGYFNHLIALPQTMPLGANLAAPIPQYIRLNEHNKQIIIQVKPQLISLSQPHPINSIINGITLKTPINKDNLEKQLTRQIIFKWQKNEKAINQTITFRRTAIFNPLNQTVTYTPWLSKNNQLDQIVVPQISGYQSNINVIPAITVKPDQIIKPVIVSYQKVS